MRIVPLSMSVSRSFALTGKLGVVGFLASLGACSNFESLRSPVFTGSTNQREIIASGPAQTTPLGGAYVGQPSTSMQSADLPPPAGAPVASAYAPPVSASPQPYTPPQGYAAAPSSPVPVTRTASANSGQRGAPPTTLGQQASLIDGGPAGGAGGKPGTHLVQSGDTAWNISQRYGVTVDQLAAANGGSTNVRLGQRLVIPGGRGAQPAPAVQVASLNPTDIPAPQPAAVTPVPAASLQSPLASAQEQAGVQQVALAPQTGSAGALAPAAPETPAAASGFRWPVRGRIISGFGKKPNGERNDGINLAVPEGTQVKAAEDGTVIYAGNELKSYGNLVLVRHTSGWVSAYAHNSKLEVKRGDQVKRGQVIALSGMSGGVTTPQVHFELRKEATPVDPLQHLSET